MIGDKKKSGAALRLENGFPYEIMAFCSGSVSCSMSRFGGVNSFQFLEILPFEGKLYPDMFNYYLLSKERGSSHQRPVYGPAIRFKSSVNGTEYYHYPEKADIYPFGFVSTQNKDGFRSGYDMLCGPGNSWSFRFKEPAGKPETWSMNLSLSHLYNGQIRMRKNQCADLKSWLPAEYREPGFDKDLPFADQLYAQLSWPELRFLPEANAFMMAGKIDTNVRPHQIYCILKFSEKVQFSQHSEFCLFTVPWKDHTEIRASVGVGYTQEEALKAAGDAVDNFESNLKREIAFSRQLCAKAPKYEVEGLDGLSKFMEILPAYQHSNLIAVTDREACIRAASYDFGYFVLWDHIYPIRDFLFTNNLPMAEKLIRYLFDYPHFRTALWSNLQLILAINEFCANEGTDRLLREAYPLFRDWFSFAKTLTDEESGFLAFMVTMAADDPHEMGLETPLFYATSINCWWYAACRVVENIARKMNDHKVCEDCFAITKKIEENFLPHFYDKKAGYPIAMLTMDKTQCAIPIHSNVLTIGLDYTYCRKLFHQVIKPMSKFQAQKLYHPVGHSAVESDSETLCEMWKNVHMNQHLGHEAKLARYAGNAAEAIRIIQGYLTYFKNTGRAVETFNLEGCNCDTALLQRWQSFSATGAAEAIRQGVCGMQFHRGGFTYLPGNDYRSIKMSGLRFAKHKLEVNIHGRGSFVRSIHVNGQKLIGSLQIPVSMMKSDLQIEIVRGNSHANSPVLLEAMDMPVDQIRTKRGTLSFTIMDTARTPVLISTQVPAEVYLNGVKLTDVEYDKEDGILWIDTLFHKNDQLTIHQMN